MSLWILDLYEMRLDIGFCNIKLLELGRRAYKKKSGLEIACASLATSLILESRCGNQTDAPHGDTSERVILGLNAIRGRSQHDSHDDSDFCLEAGASLSLWAHLSSYTYPSPHGKPHSGNHLLLHKLNNSVEIHQSAAESSLTALCGFISAWWSEWLIRFLSWLETQRFFRPCVKEMVFWAFYHWQSNQVKHFNI